jgi:hypothetical protein
MGGIAERNATMDFLNLAEFQDRSRIAYCKLLACLKGWVGFIALRSKRVVDNCSVAQKALRPFKNCPALVFRRLQHNYGQTSFVP